MYSSKKKIDYTLIFGYFLIAGGALILAYVFGLI